MVCNISIELFEHPLYDVKAKLICVQLKCKKRKLSMEKNEAENNGTYDVLKLQNQLCFPLYACSKEIIRAYKPFLDEIDLTYTQYITMMVLWEKKEMNVKTLGENLFLDSGTLTPVLKKLETKGLLKRNRSKDDERNLLVTITPEGEQLKEQAKDIPAKIGNCVKLNKEDAKELYRLLYMVIDNIR